MELNKKELQFVLECIAQKPVQTNLAGVINGVKPDQDILDIINKIQTEIAALPDEEKVEAAEETTEENSAEVSEE